MLVNRFNLYNVRLEASRKFRNKMKEYLKDNVCELTMESVRTRKLRSCRGIK
jgi:hypothetical protein